MQSTFSSFSKKVFKNICFSFFNLSLLRRIKNLLSLLLYIFKNLFLAFLFPKRKVVKNSFISALECFNIFFKIIATP